LILTLASFVPQLRHGNAAGLRPLDAAGTPAGGQRRNETPLGLV
jgi:hypothetical protein